MDFLEVIILLALTFGGSIIKLISEKKKKQAIDESMPSERKPHPLWKDILIQELEKMQGEETDKDFYEEDDKADDFLPKSEKPQKSEEKTEIVTPTEAPTFSPEKESERTLTNGTMLTSTLRKETLLTSNLQKNIQREEENNPGENEETNEILDDLSDIDGMKKAIIYHEILSPKF